MRGRHRGNCRGRLTGWISAIAPNCPAGVPFYSRAEHVVAVSWRFEAAHDDFKGARRLGVACLVVAPIVQSCDELLHEPVVVQIRPAVRIESRRSFGFERLPRVMLPVGQRPGGLQQPRIGRLVSRPWRSQIPADESPPVFHTFLQPVLLSAFLLIVCLAERAEAGSAGVGAALFATVRLLFFACGQPG